jgi:type II secretory pathway component GspD/PulD (secretin)
MELQKGQTATARQMATEAFDPRWGVEAEAAQVLRSIDAEEFNQKLLVASRTFDAGMSAYQRGDYSQAGTIFRTIDPRLLPAEKQARLKEVMMTAGMQPAAVTQAQFAAGQASVAQASPPAGSQPGRAHISDRGPAEKPMTNADFAQQVRAMNEVKFQKLRADGVELVKNATNQFKAGQTDQALNSMRDYLSHVQESGLDADHVALLKNPVESRMRQLETVKNQRDFEKMQQEARNSKSQTMERLRLAEEDKQKQMVELNKQYQALFHEGKYQEAEVVAMRMHDLDPNDQTAALSVAQARMQEDVTKANKQKQQKDDYVEKMLTATEVFGEAVGTKNPVAYDNEIFKYGKNRKPLGDIGVTHARDEKEREIYRKLDQPIGSVDFKDTSLRQILEDLQGMTGINIVPDESALQEAGISLDRPMSKHLENIALKSVLNLVLRDVHLTYVVRDQVLNITTEEHARGRMVTKVYQVADLVIPVENASVPSAAEMLHTTPQAVGEPNLKLGGGSTPWLGPNSMSNGQPVSQSQMGGNVMTSQPTVTKKGPTGTIEETLMNLIKSAIAPQSWASVGGQATIDFYPLGMALIINQTPDIQEQIGELLAALRRLQDQEVAVEVRFITIAESFYEEIGLNFNINIQNNQPRYAPQLVSQQFQPAGQINNFSPRRFLTGLTPGGSFTQDLSIPITNSSFGMAVPPFGQFPNNPGSNGGLSMGLAFLSDIQVFMFMEAAQGDQRTNVMSAPKLTLFNGQTSVLTVTDMQFFVTNVSVVQAGGQVIFVPFNTPIPTGGIIMTIQATISADRRYVRMNMTPTLTNLASANVALFPMTTFITPIFEGGAVGQPVPFTQFLQQPVIDTVGVLTTVNVPDGGTVLLGGLKRLSEGRNEFGPPILSKIPYIDRLFKNVGYGREAESLMMMVTPRIIIGEEEEERQVGPATTVAPAAAQR